MSWNRWRFDRHTANLFVWAIIFLGCLFVVAPADAGIISNTNVTIAAAPASVVPGSTITGATPIIFAESSGTIPAGGMPVDHVVTGNISVAPVSATGVVDPSLVKGTLAAGTPYDSYFFHFDFGP